MKRKILHLLLAVFVSFGLWLYVITTVNPGYEANYYNIPVKMINESVLADRGLMLNVSATPTVSLKLSGNRSDLIRLDSDDIIITVDLSGIHEAGVQSLNYTISYPGDISAGSIEVLSKLPSTVTVVTVETATKTIPIVPVFNGAVPEGYLSDKETVQMDVSSVKIHGPASVVEQISRAEVYVDLEGKTESISGTFSYVLCDASGTPVTATGVTADVSQVNLSLNIQRVKEISLILNVLYGSGTNSTNTTITIDPLTIYVSGSEQALAGIGDQLLLGELDMNEVLKEILGSDTENDLKDSWSQTFEIKLPDGVENFSNEQEVTVSVSFEGIKVKKLFVSNIKPVNVPAGFEAKVMKRNLEVIVCGPTAQINALTQADLSASVDLSSATGVTDDYFTANVRIEKSGFDKVGIVKAEKAAIKIILETIPGATESR